MRDFFTEWLLTIQIPEGDLKELQKKGKNTLLKLGFPFKNQENWRFSNLNKIKSMIQLEEKGKDNIGKEVSLDELILEKECFNQIIINEKGYLVKDKDLPEGVEIISKEELGEYLQSQLTNQETNDNWLIALNNMLTTNILALRIVSKANISIDLIVENQKPCLASNRVLFIVEEGARLDLIEFIKGSISSSNSHLIELNVGNNAKVNHSFIALGENNSLVSNINVFQEKESFYNLNYLQTDWSFSRIEPSIFQCDGNAMTRLNGLQVTDNGGQQATHSSVKFNGPNGKLEQLHKSIIKSNSHSVFQGMIQVPQIAQKTNASQLNKNLLLSEKGKVDTKPELNITADDVICTHGATVSQLREEELFYLQSRGLSEIQASQLIISGFAQEILENLPERIKKSALLKQLIK